MPLKHFFLFFFILLIITLLDFFYLGRPAVGIDDANIFMNYAWHLKQGEGFVFNHGGEHVEGFTSLLWVLVIRCFYAVSSHPEKLMMAFLLLLTSVTAMMVYREVSAVMTIRFPSHNRKKFLIVFSFFLVCIAPTYVAWSVLSLMENGLWNFIFITIVVLVLQYFRNDLNPLKKVLLVIAGMLLLLTRPEAMAWVVFFTVIMGINAQVYKRGLKFTALFFTAMAITSAALTLFRQRYFGYPFPNTYYAKVSDDEFYNIKEGVLYLIRFITSYHPMITFLFCLLLIFLVKKFQLKDSNIRQKLTQFHLWTLFTITSVLIVILALPIATGGDHFGGFRFYQPSLLLFAWALPMVFFLAGGQTPDQDFTWRLPAFALTLTFILFTAGSLYRLKNLPETRMDFEFRLASSGRWDATQLNNLWKQHPPSVGMITVGGFSLKYEGETIDLMGLNNTVMGHSAGDRHGIKNHAAFNKDVFYKLNPDIILPAVVQDETHAREHLDELEEENSFVNQAMKNILSDSLFTATYHPMMLQKDSTKVFAFVNSRFENKLTSDTIRLTKLRL